MHTYCQGGKEHFVRMHACLSAGCSADAGAAGCSSGVDILVATPGRLMAHLRGTPGATLQHLRYLVRGLPAHCHLTAP